MPIDRDQMTARQKANGCNQDRVPADWGRPCCDVCVCAAQAEGRDGMAERVVGLVRILNEAGSPEDRAREVVWRAVTDLWEGDIDRQVVDRAVRSGPITEAEAEEFLKNG